MKPRTVSLGLLAVGLLAAAPSHAATLTTDRSCYQEGEALTLNGTGFTPSGEVTLALDGASVITTAADGAGSISVRGPAPVIDPSRQRRFSLVAVDATNPALTATATPFATILDVDVTPDGGSKTRVRKITARGFTRGKTLYLHIRHRRYKRNIRLGALKAPCGTKIVRKRLFSRRAPAGVYRLQFDARRKYSGSTVPRVTFFPTITTIIVPRRSSQAAFAPPGWVGLP